MRRAWLLALLVAPTVAAAQTATGTIRFDNGRPRHPDYINKDECDGGRTIDLDWTVSFLTSVAQTVPSGGKYQVYASNQAHPADSCFTTDDTNTSRRAGKAGVEITAVGPSDSENVDPSQIVSVAGKNCTGTGTDDIFVCVLGTSAGTTFGVAKGTVHLSVVPPGKPTITSITEGNDALYVGWDAPSFTSSIAEADWYEVVASTAGTIAKDVNDITVNPYKIGGLTNDVEYAVRVYAFTVAGNRGEPSAEGHGTPRRSLSFWEIYEKDGREQGGCASGAAGALALLGTASLLLVARRRK